MSNFFIFFHDYRLTQSCLSQSCTKNHPNNLSRCKVNTGKLISCIPLLGGQLAGISYLQDALIKIKTSDQNNILKISGISLFIRGLICLLGLGILCLLIDLIITLTILIKNKLQA